MAAFSEGGISSPDIYIALLALLLLLTSSLLNSLVFLHNWRKPSSVARSLYLALSAVDFTSSCVVLLNYGIRVLQPKDPNCTEPFDCDHSYYLYAYDADSWDIAIAVVAWTLGQAPSYFTGFLVTTRYYRVRYPFSKIRKKRLLLVAALFCLHCPVVLLTDFLNSSPVVVSSTQLAWSLPHMEIGGEPVDDILFILTYCFPSVVIQAASVLASLLTIWELVKIYRNPMSERSKTTSVKGSVKIIIANLGSCVSLTMTFVVMTNSKGDREDIGLKEAVVYAMYSAGIPSLLSIFNPAIYMLFTPDFRRGLRKRVVVQQSAVGPTTT